MDLHEIIDDKNNLNMVVKAAVENFLDKHKVNDFEIMVNIDTMSSISGDVFHSVDVTSNIKI